MNQIDVKIVNSGKEYLKWSFRTAFRREKNYLTEQ